MSRKFLSIFCLLSIPLPSFATPLPFHQVYYNAMKDVWKISDLNLHFMTEYTGLPNNVWPDGMKFPSSIVFGINMLDANYTCTTTWPKGLLPNSTAVCAEKEKEKSRKKRQERVDSTMSSGRYAVEFGMRQRYEAPEYRPEMHFVLGVRRTKSTVGGEMARRDVWYGETVVSALEQDISCTLGAPFDGMRCKSIRAEEIEAEMVV
ncbi:hypothetical protein CC78DRAFT_587365 [Lojkania enalia]|uniref:Uncharacterized protein n=1 Tax=Lojkania enalia TaxID=147567 RepID=A0A9P4K052_9PLEO|nr:hypothetical protein CC78DRAFT_587365 [Didymosphaeria enalia]